MKNYKIPLIIAGIVISVFLMFTFAFNGVKNKAISYDEQIQTAYSEIKVQEKRRADLIPNLVDCVKEYDKHEYQTLTDAVKTRNTNSDADVKEIQNMISAVAEAYPELKSSENYKELMHELSITENKIANTRSGYNTSVNRYRAYVRHFPNAQILGILGYDVIDYKRLDFDISEDAPKNLFE